MLVVFYEHTDVVLARVTGKPVASFTISITIYIVKLVSGVLVVTSDVQ